MPASSDTYLFAHFRFDRAGGGLFAKLGKGDVVIAPKLGRLFRSALDALTVVEALRDRGVKLHMLDLEAAIFRATVSRNYS
jgi:DNA invertase Pin-like site-specific DNA recombinase